MIELRYETLRVVYLRSFWVLAVLAISTGAAMAWAFLIMTSQTLPADTFADSATLSVSIAMTHGPLAPLTSVLLGILVAGHDVIPRYSSTTAVLFPRRGRVFLARLAAVAATSVLVAGTTAGVSFAIAVSLVPSEAHLDGGSTVRVALAFCLAQGLLALLAGCLALLLGSTTFAVVVTLGWALAVEPTLRLLSLTDERFNAIAAHLPLAAAGAMTHESAPPAVLYEPMPLVTSPLGGGLALLTYTALLLIAAWIRFRSREFI